jgi:hypothetical protein
MHTSIHSRPFFWPRSDYKHKASCSIQTLTHTFKMGQTWLVKRHGGKPTIMFGQERLALCAVAILLRGLAASAFITNSPVELRPRKHALNFDACVRGGTQQHNPVPKFSHIRLRRPGFKQQVDSNHSKLQSVGWKQCLNHIVAHKNPGADSWRTSQNQTAHLKRIMKFVDAVCACKQYNGPFMSSANQRRSSDDGPLLFRQSPSTQRYTSSPPRLVAEQTRNTGFAYQESAGNRLFLKCGYTVVAGLNPSDWRRAVHTWIFGLLSLLFVTHEVFNVAFPSKVFAAGTEESRVVAEAWKVCVCVFCVCVCVCVCLQQRLLLNYVIVCMHACTHVCV